MKKLLSFFFTMCLLACILSTGLFSVTVSAATRNEAVNWLKAQNGAWYDIDGAYGAQCSDFASAYMNWLVTGNPHGGAYGVYNANYYPTVAGWDTSKWEVIPNYYDFVPQPGDIFVSVGADSNFGHVGVVISSNIQTATVIDQNYVNWNLEYGSNAVMHDITWSGAYSPTYYIRFKNFSSASLITPTITFGKSSYTKGETINIFWEASPANSNLSHYWITIHNPDGSVYATQGLQKNTSFSFKATNIGNYKVKVYATPVGSQSGEGSLTDTKTITVNNPHTTHTYSNDCDTTCNICGAIRSTNHRWAPADCTTPATCYICYATIGTVRGHTYSNNCDKSCNVCGKTRTVGAHKYSNACDTTCNYCNAKRTIKHTYSNACDTSCNVCKATRSITHAYKTTTTKATLTKNGSIVKKCTVCGKVASNSTIKYVKSFKLSTTTYTYNGKVKTPSVTVKDSAGKTLKKNTDYTVTYASGRKNVGTYKVTVKMIGKYSGTKTLTFKINPTKTTVSKLTAGKKSITVVITKKSTQVTGYQIQYSTSKTFSKATTKTISSYKTTKYTLKSLSAKKTYYVRVRTYKTVGKTKYYSGWSTYKYVKTK